MRASGALISEPKQRARANTSGGARIGRAVPTVVALALLPAAASAEPCGDGAELYRQLAASIVRVEVGQGANIFQPPGLGSGVVIADRLVVTADHVVAGAQSIAVFVSSGVRHDAQVVRHDPAADLALLRVRALGAVPAVELSIAGHPPPGRCVAGLGSVVRAGIGIFCGIVSLIAPPDPGGYRGILTDITAPPGFSGGALVDCATGQAVGIVTSGLVDLASPGGTAGIIGAVPVAALLELLSDTTAQD